MRMYIKKDNCDANDTLQKLLNVDLSDVNIRKKIPEVGVGAKLLTQEFKKGKKVRCAFAFINPNLMADCLVEFAVLVTKLAEVKQTSDKVNHANDEYKKFMDDVVAHHRESFQEFDLYNDRVDSFYLSLCTNDIVICI